jgi:hypothetical protein
MRRYQHLTKEQTLALVADARARMAAEAQGNLFDLSDEDFADSREWFYEALCYVEGVSIPTGDPETDACSEGQPTPFVSAEAADRALEGMGYVPTGESVGVAGDLLVGFADLYRNGEGRTARLCVGVREHNWED